MPLAGHLHVRSIRVWRHGRTCVRSRRGSARLATGGKSSNCRERLRADASSSCPVGWNPRRISLQRQRRLGAHPSSATRSPARPPKIADPEGAWRPRPFRFRTATCWRRAGTSIAKVRAAPEETRTAAADKVRSQFASSTTLMITG